MTDKKEIFKTTALKQVITQKLASKTEAIACAGLARSGGKKKKKNSNKFLSRSCGALTLYCGGLT